MIGRHQIATKDMCVRATVRWREPSKKYTHLREVTVLRHVKAGVDIEEVMNDALNKALSDFNYPDLDVVLTFGILARDVTQGPNGPIFVFGGSEMLVLDISETTEECEEGVIVYSYQKDGEEIEGRTIRA